MSLYDDFKKETTQQSDIQLKEEMYEIVKDPIYKRKELYILLSTIIAVVTVVTLLLYTPKFEMEDLSGKNESYAKTYSENYNLRLSVTTEFNDEYSKDQIYEQSLKAKESYKEGIVLEVKISKGPDYEKKITYPDFSKMTYDEAVEWKKKNFAKGAKIQEEDSSDYEKGTLIKEDIDESAKKDFKRSTDFTVTYSRGEALNAHLVKVENFDGKTVGEVATWAYKNGLTLTVNEMFDDYLPMGSVLQQNIKAGETIEKGSAFEITVCVGKGATVPNFYGVDKVTAANSAAKAGVAIVEKSIYNANVAAGGLISQSVGAGTKIKETDTVELVYSLGNVPINNYQGMNYIDVVSAVNGLNDMGGHISLGVVYVDNPEGLPSGSVQKHTYANKFVVPGTTITLYLYR